MEIFTYILIGLYALLTGFAGLQQWKENGFRIRALLFMVVSITILVTIFLRNKDWVFILLVLEFALLQMLAILEGLLTNGKLKYSHHIIRFIFHGVLLAMVYTFIN